PPGHRERARAEAPRALAGYAAGTSDRDAPEELRRLFSYGIEAWIPALRCGALALYSYATPIFAALRHRSARTHRRTPCGRSFVSGAAPCTTAARISGRESLSEHPGLASRPERLMEHASSQPARRPRDPAARGLYDPANEHDSCGVGFVAHIKGRKSHKIIEQGLQILCNLDHRGAV